MEELHRGDDVEEDSRLPVADDGRLSEQQVGDIRERQMVSQRRYDMWCGTSIIGFADDALVVCAAEDVRIVEPRINGSLWRIKRWLDSRSLKMASERTEALPVTDRRSFQYQKLVLEEHEGVTSAIGC